jgi:hypothetical protein
MHRTTLMLPEDLQRRATKVAQSIKDAQSIKRVNKGQCAGQGKRISPSPFGGVTGEM